MRNVFKGLFLTVCLCTLCAQADVQEFRLDQNRLWLTAKDEPLPQLLERFAAAGIDVQIDPAAQKNVTGSCSAADVEKILDELLAPYDYLLDWQREPSPLGTLTRLTGIRVFRKGHAESVQPLRSKRRIETSFDGKSRFMAREIVVGFGAGASIENLRAFLARTGGTVIEANQKLGVYRILLPEGANVLDLVGQLGNEPSIALAEPNYVYGTPRLLPANGGPSGIPSQWNAPAGNSPFAVAVLDSGLIPDDNLNRAVIGSFDATNPNTPLTTDAVGHGTLMARIAAGLVDPYNNPVGEGSPVVIVKAFADDGLADSFTLMNAMTYAMQKSSGPISLSWGSETPSKFIEIAVQYAISQGRPVVAAVGNKNTGIPMYPAACDGVIGVAASGEEGQYAGYSNQGDFVDIVIAGSAGGSQGTSVSTATAANLIAGYQLRHPEASGTEAGRALIAAAGPDKFLSTAEAAQFRSK